MTAPVTPADAPVEWYSAFHNLLWDAAKAQAKLSHLGIERQELNKQLDDLEQQKLKVKEQLENLKLRNEDALGDCDDTTNELLNELLLKFDELLSKKQHVELQLEEVQT